jgi:hypothetical protein
MSGRRMIWPMLTKQTRPATGTSPVLLMAGTGSREGDGYGSVEGQHGFMV